MEGKFIHVTEVTEHCYRFDKNYKESKTEQKVSWSNPGKELWNIMQEEMYHVYGDVDHIDITLFMNMVMDNQIDDIKSWAGFRYYEYNSVEDDYTCYDHWYLFV